MGSLYFFIKILFQRSMTRKPKSGPRRMPERLMMLRMSVYSETSSLEFS